MYESPNPEEILNAVSNVTYTVTVSNNLFIFDGSRHAFLTLERGKTYIFNQDDS